MQKPISIAINEIQNLLTDICNKSGLPACILELIVKDLYNEIKNVSAIQLKHDKKAYTKSQKEAQNGKNEHVNK